MTAQAIKARSIEAVGPSCLESGAYIGVQFGVYELLKRIWLGPAAAATELMSPLAALLMGSIAAAITQVCTCPLKLIVVRIQSGSPHGFLGTAREVYRESGLLGFWRGLSAALMVVLDPSITLFAYDRLQDLLMRVVGTAEVAELQSFHLLLTGMLSKCAAVLITYPIRYAKVKLQAVKGGKDGVDGPTSMVQVFGEAIQQGKAMSLYDGLTEDLAQCCLKYGLVFMLRTRVLEVLQLLFTAKARAKRGL